MVGLIHIVYFSAARPGLTDDDLARILAVAREHNARAGVTGLLLHADGTFFQVLEGEATVVDELMRRIDHDPRHHEVVTIVREPIARRSFADWTMGFAALSASEVAEIVGASDFFHDGASFARLGPGRARKLLAAFREGRWRSRLAGRAELPPATVAARTSGAQAFTFAFQPIVDVASGTVVSYEALVRGRNREPAASVLQGVAPEHRRGFDEGCRCGAIELAASLGLPCALNLNFRPLAVDDSRAAIAATLASAARCGIDPSRIVLEILESEIIHDHDGFAQAVNEHRAFGLRTAIDDFGAGYAGLTLLAGLLPDLVKLDMGLIRDVERIGPRQAVIRGVLRTCLDLGIDVVAEGVETAAELDWLRGEGITLFQGNFFAEPAFEHLPQAVVPTR